jgi:hypothetical protein
MNGEIQTDEYSISISREIAVCKNMINRQRKNLARFEKQYDISSEKMIIDGSLKIEKSVRDMNEWRNEYEGLLAWRQRLQEYEKAYNALKH